MTEDVTPETVKMYDEPHDFGSGGETNVQPQVVNNYSSFGPPARTDEMVREMSLGLAVELWKNSKFSSEDTVIRTAERFFDYLKS